MSISPARRMGWSRVISLLSLTFLFAVLGGIAWFYSAARAALPQLDGAVLAAGLKANVAVTRDAQGVPTIEAENVPDLLFAQGYVTAQDRLWQMDIMKRYAAGELAEILGSDLLNSDKEQRILGLRMAARKALEVASPEEQARFEAYARGINAFIETHRRHLPLEFRILRYAPQPWTPEDSMLAAVQMVKNLNHDKYQQALTREKILAKLGPELTADLYVNSSWRDRPPTMAKFSLQGSSRSDDEEGDDSDDDDTAVSQASPPRLPDRNPYSYVLVQAEEWMPVLRSSISAFKQLNALRTTFLPGLESDFTAPAEGHQVEGSNNWVVSGAHTVSGKPLLSNDMHLGHQMPNLWYEAHLKCPEMNVAGVTLPGLPYVVVGHNQRVAWGFTNVGPTVEDVYIENFNAEGKYHTAHGWQNAEHRREIIHVKNAPDVVVDVLSTRHGPIISDLVPGETRRLALRWTLYDGVHNPFYSIDTAQNWQDFRRAFVQLDAPGQNVVYADVDGNIGYQATGKIPIRAAGDGGLPENGSDDSQEWTGYIPFDKLPSVYNPPAGILATANGRIAPDNYPYSISTGWEAPWRSARIYRVLESGKRFSPADMLSLQMDVYSDSDRFYAEHLAYAVDHASNPSARTKEAAEILRAWDGRVTANSAAATITSRCMQELMRRLLEPKLGPAPVNNTEADASLNWKSYRWQMETIWLENVLQHQPKRWLPAPYANYEELIAAAVDSVVTGADAPKGLNGWAWGKSHPLEITHPILGKIPLLGRWSGPGLREQSGSSYTVKAVSRHHGPSERLTVDMANLDQSTLNLVTGQGGNFLSPHYMDQWKAWYGGTTFSLPFSPAAVEKTRTHELLLEPAR